MLRARSLLASRAFSRSYATATPPHALVLLEHKQGALESNSLSALTAAEQLGGNVTALIIGQTDHVQAVVDKAKKSLPPSSYITSRLTHFPQAQRLDLHFALHLSPLHQPVAGNSLTSFGQAAF